MHISIFSPTKNRSFTYIPILLESILIQKLPNDWSIEWVLCDDGSDVNDYKNLQKTLANSGLKHILLRHNESLGPSSSRNDAYRACKGEYILDLDDDDVLTENAVHLRVKHLIETGAKWSFTNAHVISDEGILLPNKELVQNWDHNNKTAEELIPMLLNNQAWYWASTRTYKNDALYKNNEFLAWDPELIVAEDLDHWIHLTKEIGPPVHLSESTVFWREKADSHGINGMKSGLQAKMIARIKEKMAKLDNHHDDSDI